MMNRPLNGYFEVVFSVFLIAVVCLSIWYTMGVIFLMELGIISAIAYAAAYGASGFRRLYFMAATVPRDLIALIRYVHFLYYVRKVSATNPGIDDIFDGIVKKDPNAVLFEFEDSKWTAKEVDEYSNRVANVFFNMGLRKGDVVALMLENRPEYVCIWLGLSKIGVITALINYNLRQKSLAHCVDISKCSVFVFGSNALNAVRDVKDILSNSVKLFCWQSLDEPVVSESWFESLTPLLKSALTSRPETSDKLTFHDNLLYIYTSGTTGLPKAAVITTARIVFLAGALRYIMWFNENDKFYTPLPLYHTAGGVVSIGQAVLFGCCVVIRKKFSASGYFPDIVKYNCTVAQYIGEMCRYLLSTSSRPEDKNHKLRLIFGNGLRPQIWKAFVTRFNIPRVAEFYGATEGNANIVNIDNTEGAIGFISRIIPSIYPISIIRVNAATGEPIRNEKGLCITCKPGEPGVFVGKISASNPARAFLGYVNANESEKKVVYNVFREGDSAFISGDILIYDDYGYLYFKDRTGDTYRWKGENVSTTEVEAVVSNVANYRDCVVYGVQIPNTEGRAGMAAIVDEDKTLDLNALAKGLQENLPSYAIPVFIRTLNQVELTGTFKLKKLDLQKEGFNPAAIKDKLYYRGNTDVYELLDEKAYNDIINNKIRL